MTDSNREIVEGVDLTPGARQDARGVDLTLVRHSSSLTPTERLAENEVMIEFVTALERSRDGAR